MAYTLKTSGLATKLLMCVAIDSDGATIKEFVSSDVNTNKVVDAGVTVGSATWQGVSRGYFQTLGSGDFNFSGITFPSGHRPSIQDGHLHGVTYFAAFAGASASTQGHAIYTSSAFLKRTSNHTSISASGSIDSGTATIPSDGTTHFSVGASHSYDSGVAFYYGVDGAGAATDGTGTNTVGRGADAQTIISIGGAAGIGNFPAKWFIACAFDGILTTTDIQSLHTDWFGTLFNTGATNSPPTFSGTIADISATQGTAITSVNAYSYFTDTDTLAYTAQGTWPAGITINSTTGVLSGTPTASGTYTSLKVRATDTASQFVDSNAFTITVAATGTGATITTSPLKNNTGQLLTSQTGATAFVYNTTTGALVVKLTGQSTNASGVMTLTDASLVASTTYRVVIVLSTGAEGMASIAAA